MPLNLNGLKISDIINRTEKLAFQNKDKGANTTTDGLMSLDDVRLAEQQINRQGGDQDLLAILKQMDPAQGGKADIFTYSGDGNDWINSLEFAKYQGDPLGITTGANNFEISRLKAEVQTVFNNGQGVIDYLESADAGNNPAQKNGVISRGELQHSITLLKEKSGNFKPGEQEKLNILSYINDNWSEFKPASNDSIKADNIESFIHRLG